MRVCDFIVAAALGCEQAIGEDLRRRLFATSGVQREWEIQRVAVR